MKYIIGFFCIIMLLCCHQNRGGNYCSSDKNSNDSSEKVFSNIRLKTTLEKGVLCISAENISSDFIGNARFDVYDRNGKNLSSEVTVIKVQSRTSIIIYKRSEKEIVNNMLGDCAILRTTITKHNQIIARTDYKFATSKN
jgi:hypothetical protein